MLKIDNESLTDKTTVVWENESGIMSTFKNRNLFRRFRRH